MNVDTTEAVPQRNAFASRRVWRFASSRLAEECSQFRASVAEGLESSRGGHVPSATVHAPTSECLQTLCLFDEIRRDSQGSRTDGVSRLCLLEGPYTAL